MQKTKMELLQVKAYMRLLSKVIRLTNAILVIYFHGTRIDKAIGLSNP